MFVIAPHLSHLFASRRALLLQFWLCPVDVVLGTISLHLVSITSPLLISNDLNRIFCLSKTTYLFSVRPTIIVCIGIASHREGTFRKWSYVPCPIQHTLEETRSSSKLSSRRKGAEWKWDSGALLTSLIVTSTVQLADSLYGSLSYVWNSRRITEALAVF